MRYSYGSILGDSQSRCRTSQWHSVLPPIAVVLTMLLAASPSAAQSSEGRRWTLTLALGEQVGGPAGSLESAMREAGFDATTAAGCWLVVCGGPTEHPWTYDEGFAPLLAVRYRLSPRLNVEALYTSGATAETFGSAGSLRTLIVRHSVSTVAAIASTNIRVAESENKVAMLRLGLGPAVHFLESAEDKGGAASDERSVARLGFVIDTGLETPTRTRFFLDLRAQWRFTGSADVGPYEEGIAGTGVATFPETSLSYSHFFFSAGVGFRL